MTARASAESTVTHVESKLWHARLYILPALLVLAHAALFRAYIIDDAYITYTSARNWAHGFGPVFMPGERVEATSSLLWTLLLTPFELIGIGSPVASKLLGAALALLVVLYVPVLLRRMRPGATGLQQLTLGCLVASCSCFVLWSNYGMENGLVALLLIVAVDRFGGELQAGAGYGSFFPIFLLETIRPEGFIFIALFVALRMLWLLREPRRWRTLLAPWLIPLVLSLLLYELAGYLYFGHLLPNPVAAKVGASALVRAKEGIRYLMVGPSAVVLYTFLGASVIALPALFGRRANIGLRALYEEWRVSPWYLTALLLCALQLLFTIMVGGDWMPMGRFVSHVAPLILTVLVAGYLTLREQAEAVARELPGMAVLLRAAALLVVLLLTLHELRGMRALQQSIGTLQRQCDAALPATVAFLNEHGSERDTVAAADIGYVGYYFKGRVYDWWGLANEEITALKQAIGNIDPNTVLKHRPRFIVLYANAPVLAEATMVDGMALYSRPFMRSAEFLAHYRQVHSAQFSATRYHVTFERVD